MTYLEITLVFLCLLSWLLSAILWTTRVKPIQMTPVQLPPVELPKSVEQEAPRFFQKYDAYPSTLLWQDVSGKYSHFLKRIDELEKINRKQEAEILMWHLVNS